MRTLDTINASDWSTVAPFFDDLASETLTPLSVPDWLERWSELEKTLGEAFASASRAKSEDTTDKAAEATYLHLVQNILPPWQVAGQGLKEKVLAVPGYSPPPEHEQMMRRWRTDEALFRPANIPLMSEIQVLAAGYDKIAGDMAVTLTAEVLTLPQAEQRLQDPDRDTREAVWRAIQQRWLVDRAPLDELYLALLPKRQRLAANADLPDYRAFLWQSLKRFDYTPHDSLAFGQAIEAEIVPLAARLLAQRRAALGVGALRPWDLAVDVASMPPLHPFSDAADLEAGSARMLANVDPELGAQFDRLRDGFLSLGSRPGKAPGGHCSFFPRTGLPYIFMNAVGTHGDVNTLLHEAGHAFHALASSTGQPLIWNWNAPMEFCEVASMAMELLAAPYLEKDKGGFYSPQDAARAKREHLEKIIQFLPYMAVVDGFQHWVYAEAGSEITAADLDAKWDELWQRFMPGIDWTGLEQERTTGWHRKLHIFKAPFYYVEYGLAQLGALQIWRNALGDQAGALAAYRRALALGNTKPLRDIYAAAGARLAFDRATVGELASLVETHLEEAAA